MTLNTVNQLPVLKMSAAVHNIDIKNIYYHSNITIRYHSIGNRRTLISASACKISISIVTEGVGMILGPYMP